MKRHTNGRLQNRNILIPGASAAGPSLAYWLHRYGFHATMVERAPALRAGGYAITKTTNTYTHNRPAVWQAALVSP